MDYGKQRNIRGQGARQRQDRFAWGNGGVQGQRPSTSGSSERCAQIGGLAVRRKSRFAPAWKLREFASRSAERQAGTSRFPSVRPLTPPPACAIGRQAW